MASNQARPFDTAAMAAAGRGLSSYRYRLWGFGEEIGLAALLSYGDASGEEAPAEFVRSLVERWCLEVRRLQPADHVAPGSVILDLYERTGDETFLDAARRLGELYRSFPKVGGVCVHRPDLEGLEGLIWVDCMALDGPFLVRLARVVQEQSWTELAVETMLEYRNALFDEQASLFRHGFDTRSGRQSACNWGRGNGWALHGLVATLAELPASHSGRADLSTTLARQVAAILPLQDESGLWHTVLDDEESPLENSTAAFFASGLLKAGRLGLLADVDESAVDLAVTRSLAVLRKNLASDGGLPVSYATPVGGRETYCSAPLGIFPWGQGPLLLAHCEALAAVEKRVEPVAGRGRPRPGFFSGGSGGTQT